MIIIDGSEGEGGGQVVRNSCALSIATGTPVRITNVRAKRSKPGLMGQHVTAIEAAAVISGAEVRGLAVGSSQIEFHPGRVMPGDYHFAVGTAGSTSLVLQTVLMPLAMAAAPSRLVLEGGTHNMLAPPFDFLQRCFLPIINRMGPKVTARLTRHGFYPRGGGRIEVEIAPAPLKPINAIERGAPQTMWGRVLFAGIEKDVAQRILDRARQDLPDWPPLALNMEALPRDEGSGIILMLAAEYEHSTELVSGFGKLGVPGVHLAKAAAARMRGYQACAAFAGPYLADQLVMPFALAGGGCFTTVEPSQHLLTAIDIARRFTGLPLALTQQADGAHLISIM